MAVNFEERYAYHPDDFRLYGIQRIMNEFLVENLMEAGNINLVYSSIERYIVGGAVPVDKPLVLDPVEPLKANYFCERREVGVINIAGARTVTVDGTEYKMEFKDAIYIGKESKQVIFKSDNPKSPACFYLNSTPAHKKYPVKYVTMCDANVLHLGALETSNERDINQLLINGVVETCQLQMGMTELKPGSVWNIMPPHTHGRRNEVYFYFGIPEGQAVCHF